MQDTSCCTGTTVLVTSENKGKCVGEEQEKPCEQAAVGIRALEWKAASTAPGPQWVQQL